ncbi:histidine kinase [Cytophagales bacterium WSM2-2]|nr:histidine kinase [Cytophagales bacterium WSM2-2]
MDLGRNEEALATLKSTLNLVYRNQKEYPELKKQIKFILNNAGIASVSLGNYDKALEYHYQSLQIREEEGDKKSIRNALNNIGLVFYNLRDYEKSIQYCLKAVAISEELHDFGGMERVYINLGLASNQLGRFNKAIGFFNEGFNICKNECDDNIVKEGLEGLGYAYQADHQYQKAKENFLKSLEISKRQNDVRYSEENLVALGKIEIDLKNEEQGLAYLKEAEALVEAANLALGKLSVYKELADFYGKKNDYQKSLSYQNKYSQFKDSIYNDQLISNLTRVQTNFDQRENLKTIAQKDQFLALQNEIIVRQQRQYFFIFAITCLVVTLAMMMFYFSKKQQRANKEISRAKNKIEEQNERLENHNKELETKVTQRTGDLLLANNALQKVNSELDYFIYKSSHDIRGPLVTLKGMCNVALMDLKDPLAIEYFRKFDVTTDKLNVILTRLQTVNYVTHSQVKPAPINFNTMIEDIILFEKKKGVTSKFSFQYDVPPGSTIVSDEFLVRTVLENLIDNSVKFRSSSERVDPYVKIKLTRERSAVKVTVEDNGIGIHRGEVDDIFKMFVRASEQSEIGGVGLYLVKTAVDKAGGEVSLLQSGPGGSVFQVLFPADIHEVISARNRSDKKLVDLEEKQIDSPPGASNI